MRKNSPALPLNQLILLGGTQQNTPLKKRIFFSFLLMRPTTLILFLRKTHRMNTPANLKYTKDHEWVSLDGDIATVGITDFAQGELGDIVFVEIETLDETLEQEAVFGSIEAVKTVSDLFMPVAGTIIEVNDEIESNPEIVNSDPYGAGWLIKVKVDDAAALENLLDAEAYNNLIGA